MKNSLHSKVKSVVEQTMENHLRPCRMVLWNNTSEQSYPVLHAKILLLLQRIFLKLYRTFFCLKCRKEPSNRSNVSKSNILRTPFHSFIWIFFQSLKLSHAPLKFPCSKALHQVDQVRRSQEQEWVKLCCRRTTFDSLKNLVIDSIHCRKRDLSVFLYFKEP